MIRLWGGTQRSTGEAFGILDINSIVAVRSMDPHAALTHKRARLDQPRAVPSRRVHVHVLRRGVHSAAADARPRYTAVAWRRRYLGERGDRVPFSCNQRKDDRLPQELGWKLRALPYAPNGAEGLILHNRKILSDQMEFLRGRVGSGSRLRAA